jgi:hypothetical protein
MALTRGFRETVQKRALRDSEFRAGLVREAFLAVLRGEMRVAKLLLRDFTCAQHTKQIRRSGAERR